MPPVWTPPQSLCSLAEANRQTCAVRRTAWWRQTPSNFSLYKPFVFFGESNRKIRAVSMKERGQLRCCLPSKGIVWWKGRMTFQHRQSCVTSTGRSTARRAFFPALIRPFEVKYVYKLLFCWLGGRCWRWRMKSYKEAKRQAEKWQESAWELRLLN